MLATVVLLLLCILTAITGVPLILKLIPPNDVYGFHTEKALSRAEIWFEVNRFAGWALVGAASLTALAVMIWSGTWLLPFWRQLLVYVLFVGIAVGATFWYERQLGQQPRGRSSHRSARQAP